MCGTPLTLHLASRSPRRATLLAEAGISFVPGPYPDVDETPPDGLTPAEVARALARRKARAVAPPDANAVVLAADTVVSLPEGELLGKPRDAADAERMLRALSGRPHEVATGVALRWATGEASAVDVAIVTFRRLDAAEIQAYVQTGEPLDKAGAYGLQGRGAALVMGVQGDPETVIGLPTALVRHLLESRPPPGR